MRFHAEHRFDAPPRAVAAVIGDPELHLGLRLPDLDPVELVAEASAGGIRTLRLRYGFAGQLDPVAARLAGGRRFTWIQELRIDPASGTGSLTFAAEGAPRLLRGAADLVLQADGDGTIRQLDGELVVAVPGIGRMAERRIVPGLLARLDIEAIAVGDRLARR